MGRRLYSDNKMWWTKKPISSAEYRELTNLIESMQGRIDIMDTNIKSIRGLVNRKITPAMKEQEADGEVLLSAEDREFIQGLNPQERDMIMEKVKNAGGL